MMSHFSTTRIRSRLSFVGLSTPNANACKPLRLWDSFQHGKGGKLDRWAFEKALEVYGAVKRLQGPPSKPCIFREERETFHFTHDDLSDQNILINPDTGEITSVIDGEMAGFRSLCLVAAAGGWFNDDSERFLMSEHQSARGDYKDETPTDIPHRMSPTIGHPLAAEA